MSLFNFSKGKREKSDGSFMRQVLALAFANIMLVELWQMAVFTFTDRGEAPTLIQMAFTFWGLEVGLLMLKTVVELWKEHRAAKMANTVEQEETSKEEA